MVKMVCDIVRFFENATVPLDMGERRVSSDEILNRKW
jgi:hypothetical protein